MKRYIEIQSPHTNTITISERKIKIRQNEFTTCDPPPPTPVSNGDSTQSD